MPPLTDNATPSVLVFDVNETLSDMEPLAQRFIDVGATPELAKLWFASLLRDGFAFAASGTAAKFADLARAGLENLLPGRVTVGDLDAAIDHVLDGFADLQVHPDVAEGVDALSALGLRLVTLSNGSAGVAERLLSGAGLRDRFEHVLSVEDAGMWKPAPSSYGYAAQVCGVSPAEMMLVAVHPWDTAGALRAGMSAAWINRTGARWPSYFPAPTLTATSLTDLAGQLA